MQSCGGPPHISGPDDVMVTAGEPFTLNVSTSGDEPTTIDWFEGALGSTDHPMGSGSQLTAVRTSTTCFWARASNSCGSSNSRLTAVTVVQCLSPSIMQEPKNVAVQQGQSATIGFQTSGAPASVQWYRGSQGDTSNPVPEATSTTLTIDHVTASASYWAQVSNGCGSASTRAAMVSMIPARHRSAGH
jgi:hypothetical protein